MADLAVGQQKYTQFCGGCHGPEANLGAAGKAMGATDLKAIKASPDFVQKVLAAIDGSKAPKMPVQAAAKPFANDIAAYIQSLQ